MSSGAPLAPAGVRVRISVTDLLRELAAGGLIGVILVVIAIALASLVFAGALAEYRAHGIALAMITVVAGAVLKAALSSIPGVVSSVQDMTAAIFAVMAAGVVATLPPGSPPLMAYVTVVAAIAATTLVTGTALVLVGQFRLGRFVRYLPYPVVGGFMAGTGWLLFSGGLGVMSGLPVDLAHLASHLQPSVLARWLPGLAFALAILVVTRVWRHPIAFPAILAAAVVAFFAVMAAVGGTSVGWREAGLLLGPFREASVLPPIRPSDLQLVHWPTVAAQGWTAGTVVFLTMMAVLFNATGLELALGRKVDLDRELRTAGLANMLTGSFGGLIGFLGVSLTMLNHRLGRGTRLAVAAAIAVVVASLLLGPQLLEFVPTFLVGGVIAYLGLSFLIEWTVGAARDLPRVEYAIVLVILLAVATLGFLPGVMLGLVLAVLLFVVSYSRVDAIRHARSGSETQSRVRWDAQERRILSRRGAEVLVLELQGFLFFGSANAFVERVEARTAAPEPLLDVVLGFKNVTGVDATALASFAALARMAAARGFRLHLTDLPPSLARSLERSLLRGPDARAVRVAPALDDALEACERRILGGSLAEQDRLSALDERLDGLAGDDLELQDLIPHLERVQVPAGHRLFEQGDDSDAVYLVATGQITSRLEEDGVPTVRLETVRGGSLVGELGFYTGARRHACFVADEPATLYRLSRDRLLRLTHEDPPLAAAFHRLVARQMAERVVHLRRVVHALQE